MDSHGSSTFKGPETPEAFLAERQRTWNAFTGATVGSIIAAAATLILMGLFLL